MPVIAATGTVLAIWIVVGAACLGWGAGLVRALNLEKTAARPAELFWAGFSLLICLLQVWHLFLPVDWLASALLLGGGVATGFVTGTFKPPFARLSIPGRTMIILAVALWLAYRGLDFPRNYDSGLYHFSSIRWANEFPAVPGLANLHERLGFNQSYFLFVALLNLHPFFNEGYHAANSLLCFVLVAQLLGTAFALRRAGTPAAVSTVLPCLLLPVVLAQALGGDISSPTPDFAVFIVGLTSFVMLVRLLETESIEGPARDRSVAVLMALLAAGCTLKLSFLVFALAVVGVMMLGAWNRPLTGGWFRVRPMALLLVGGCVLWGFPLAINGIILSGYPAFPSTALAWPRDWRLPAVDAEITANWIRSWGRSPGGNYQEVLGSWDWLGPWWQRTIVMPGVYLPLLATGGGGLAIVAAGWRERSRWRRLTRWLPPFAPLLAGLAFWFFTAPDPRFASWLIWLLPGWTLACAVSMAQDSGTVSLPRVLATVALGACLGVVVLGIPSWVSPRRYGFDSLPRIETREFVTHSGLKVHLPANAREPRLWDAPLPSAPRARPGLELRGAGLRDGFRTAPCPPSKNE